MRIAVISDIHANLHALVATLAAIDVEAVDEVWCLGDLVGYGPRPNECVALIQKRAARCLAGNHDLVVLGKIDLSVFAGEAAAAAEWTRAELDRDAARFLEGLEPAGRAPRIDLFHGSPFDPVWEYVLDEPSAARSFRATTAPLVLVGHSHVALEIADGEQLRGERAAADTVLELSDRPRRLLNPGSVGQPRDGDSRAAWLVIDTASRRATFRRTVYPIGLTQGEMRERGLPQALSERLAFGI